MEETAFINTRLSSPLRRTLSTTSLDRIEIEPQEDLVYSRREAELIQNIFGHIIRYQPNIIKLFYGRVKTILHNSLSSCFVNLSSSQFIFPLLFSVIKDEFETNSHDAVLRENCIASKIIKAYLEKIGREYIINILGKLINGIASDQKLSFEIDPNKVKQEEVEQNLQALENKATEFLKVICAPENIKKMPVGIRIIACFIAQQSRHHVPEQVKIMIGSFLFLRYFNPAIFSPETIDGLLWKVKQIGNVPRRNLIMIAKVLQNLANEKQFGGKESFMKHLDTFIAKHKTTLDQYFNQVTNFTYRSNMFCDTSSRYVSDDDLQIFHILLYQNPDLIDQFIDKTHATEFSRLLEKLGPYSYKESISTLEKTDKRSVRIILRQRNEEATFVSYVNLTPEKEKEKKKEKETEKETEIEKTTKHILIVGRRRVILSRPKETRLVRDYHQLDLLRIVSERPGELSLVFRTVMGGESVLKCTAKGEKVDNIIDALRRSYAYVFHDDSSYELRVTPTTRLRPVDTNLSDDDSSCFGLSETYKSLCEYYDGVALDWATCNIMANTMCNTIQKLVDNTKVENQHRALYFNRSTMLSRFTLSGKDTLPLFHALGYNSFFTTLVLKQTKLEKSSLEGLAKMLAINTSITSLTLEHVTLREHSPKIGFFDLFNALAANPACALRELDLRGTVMNGKDRKQLALFLAGTRTGLVKLDLSQKYSHEEKNSLSTSEKVNNNNNNNNKDDGLKGILMALSLNNLFGQCLALLNLDGNLLHRAHVDALCLFLKNTTTIKVLQLSRTCVNLSILLSSGLFSPQCSESLTKLDLSNQKQTPSQWEELLHWLESPTLCCLEYLDISNTQIPIESFLKILQHRNKNRFPGENGLSIRASKNDFGKEAGAALGSIIHNVISIVSLDLSDNVMGDDGVQDLVKGLSQNAIVRQLDVSRNFRFQNEEKRRHLIEDLVQMIRLHTLRLQSLKMAGAKNRNGQDSRLKEHLLPLISSMSWNTSLTNLDISGHASGPSTALSLAQLLELNHSLVSLHWDGNHVGLVGIQCVSKSLKVNTTMREMPLPVMDITWMLKEYAMVTAMGGGGVDRKEVIKALEGIERELMKNRRENKQ